MHSTFIVVLLGLRDMQGRTSANVTCERTHLAICHDRRIADRSWYRPFNLRKSNRYRALGDVVSVTTVPGGVRPSNGAVTL